LIILRQGEKYLRLVWSNFIAQDKELFYFLLKKAMLGSI